MDVSIILVNYNTCELTCNCIKSIYAQVRSLQYEIIVVDNASVDESVKTISSEFPEVNVVSSDENLGFGRANNLGVSCAKGKFLFLLNTDTILHNDPFPYFIEKIKSESNIGVVGAFLKNHRGEYVQSGGRFYTMKKYLKMYLFKYLRKSYPSEVDFESQGVEVDYVIGADMLLKRDLFEEIGGFDKRIFMYFEDVELCKRIAQLELQSYLIKGPDITHLVGGSSSSMFSKIYNTASLMYCIKKETTICKFRMFQLVFFLLKFPLLLLNIKKIKENWTYLMVVFNYKKYLLSE